MALEDILSYYKQLEEPCRVCCIRLGIKDPLFYFGNDDPEIKFIPITNVLEIVSSCLIPKLWIEKRNPNLHMIICILINDEFHVCKYPFLENIVSVYAIGSKKLTKVDLTELKNTFKASVIVKDIKGCWNPACKNIGKFKRCAICKKVAYCSRECQVSQWKYHKRSCVPEREICRSIRKEK